MAVTKISDVIVPEHFAAYVIERTAEKSKILNSGIAVANPRLNELITGGGTTINMPYWKDLSGADEVLSDSSPLTPGKIDADKDVAAVLYRGKAFGANELAGALAGDDPVDAIVERFADYRARQEQKTLIAVLTGAFAAASMSNHVLNRSTTAISGNMVLDAKQLLGDSADQLQAIMMHSAVFTELQKQNLIQYTTTSDGKIAFATYLGYNIVVDDGMPVEQVYKKTSDVAIVSGKTYYTYNSSTGVYTPVASPDVSDIGDYYEEDYKVYTTYLFARGSVGRGEGTPVALTLAETDRDSLAGDDFVINRWALVMHPMGVKWKGTPSGATPSNAELATGTNWERVYEDKNIGIVALKHKLS